MGFYSISPPFAPRIVWAWVEGVNTPSEHFLFKQ